MSYFISKYHNLNIKQIQQFFINYTNKYMKSCIMITDRKHEKNLK